MIAVAGQTLDLLAQRAAFWRERTTLLVADPHFGKAEAFRAQSLPVPGASTPVALARLDAALAATDAKRLVVLGDFWHARASRTPEVLADLADWKLRHPDLVIEIVLGNHDRGVGLPPASWDALIHADAVPDPPFAFAHYPDAIDGHYVLAGHLHPSLVLTGRGRQRLKLPGFWFGPAVGVLPAFGEFTGGAVVTPGRGDRAFVVAGDQVVEVS